MELKSLLTFMVYSNIMGYSNINVYSTLTFILRYGLLIKKKKELR